MIKMQQNAFNFCKILFSKTGLQSRNSSPLPLYSMTSLAKTKCIKDCSFKLLGNYLLNENASFHTSCHEKLPNCDLTIHRYSVTRGPFRHISADDIQFFKGLLGEHRVINDENELLSFNTDWLKTVRGFSSLLLKPKTTQEVSNILRYCNDKNLAVCPQGGNTGVVGGSVPVFDEIIVSLSLMNQIENVDEFSGVLTCQAGCILEHLDQHVEQYGLMMPLDLGAKGSCQIGGNVSTNAGGLRVLRYGNLHGSVLGVEAVLASGEIIDCISSMKKDNTGYALKHLFIGSEGTLGIVTKISIQCPPKPKATNVVFLGLDSFDNVLKTYKEAKWNLGEILSSCEFIDDITMDCIKSNLKLTSPIGQHKFYMLIETSGSNNFHDEEKLSSFLESAMNSKVVKDGTLATEPSKIQELWTLRERVAEAWLCDGYTFLYDVSLPLQVFYKVVEIFQEKFQGKVIRVGACGHLGDGNLHLCVTTKKYDEEILHGIEPHLFELTAKYKGSISSEHGLGFQKRNAIYYSKSESAVVLMKQLKSVMDPKGILNPYKVLPENEMHKF